MKRLQTKYSENNITFWPSYEAGKIGVIFLGVLGALFSATSVWILLDNPSRKTCLEILIAFPLVLVVLFFIFSFIFRRMQTKIVVSKEGVWCFNSKGMVEKQIYWKNVSAVYFSQEPWYGRKTCRIFIDKLLSPVQCEKDACDFILPVASVDEQKLLQLIPNYLWKNNPWYS